MKKQIKKNIIQRKIFKTNEQTRIVLKAISCNLQIHPHTRWKIQSKFRFLPIKSSLVRINNMCVLTGRSSSIYRFFKLSRLQLRKWASNGYLPGMSKYSW